MLGSCSVKWWLILLNVLEYESFLSKISRHNLSFSLRFLVIAFNTELLYLLVLNLKVLFEFHYTMDRRMVILSK